MTWLHTTTLLILMLSAVMFLVTGIRMTLTRPAWTVGRGSQAANVWLAFTALMFVMVAVSIRDVVIANEIEPDSLFGMLLRLGKLITVSVVFWTTLHPDREDDHDPA